MFVNLDQFTCSRIQICNPDPDPRASECGSGSNKIDQIQTQFLAFQAGFCTLTCFTIIQAGQSIQTKIQERKI